MKSYFCPLPLIIDARYEGQHAEVERFFHLFCLVRKFAMSKFLDHCLINVTDNIILVSTNPIICVQGGRRIEESVVRMKANAILMQQHTLLTSNVHTLVFCTHRKFDVVSFLVNFSRKYLLAVRTILFLFFFDANVFVQGCEKDSCDTNFHPY